MRAPTDDGEHQRQAVAGGTHDRLGAATDTDPRSQAALGARVHLEAGHRRPGRAAPRDGLLAEQVGEQVELLLEQLLVAFERVPEQRERLGERAAPEDHLGAPVRHRVDRGEALEHADRVVGAEHRDRGPEADPLGASGDGGQHHLGRGDREVVAVVFADAEEVEAEVVGQHRLVDHVADHLCLAQAVAVGVDGDVTEGVEAEFDRGTLMD